MNHKLLNALTDLESVLATELAHDPSENKLGEGVVDRVKRAFGVKPSRCPDGTHWNEKTKKCEAIPDHLSSPEKFAKHHKMDDDTQKAVNHDAARRMPDDDDVEGSTKHHKSLAKVHKAMRDELHSKGFKDRGDDAHANPARHHDDMAYHASRGAFTRKGREVNRKADADYEKRKAHEKKHGRGTYKGESAVLFGAETLSLLESISTFLSEKKQGVDDLKFPGDCDQRTITRAAEKDAIVKHGGNHDTVIDPETGQVITQIPRHDPKTGTCRAIISALKSALAKRSSTKLKAKPDAR